MAGTERLERLIADRIGECCAGDVDRRLDELADLAASAATDRADRDVETLSALASGTRYRIVRLLLAADGELCVCELTPLLDVSESAISHALADLTEAGLVDRRKEGKWRYYDATDRAARLVTALEDTRA